MAFQALKNSCEIAFRPIKKFDDLAIGTYLVSSFSLKDTKYGRRIFVNIGEFCVVLPPRFMERVNKQKQIDELNASSFNMIYNGKDKDKKDLLMLKFVEVFETSDDDDTANYNRASTSSSTRSADEADGAAFKRRHDDSADVDEPLKKSRRKRAPKRFF